MKIDAAAVSSPSSGVEVTVVGTAVKSSSGPRSSSVAAMSTHDEEQESTTNMGIIFTADHRIREHARIVKRMAQIQTNINQAELNAKLLERRTARCRAGSPIIRSAISLEQPLGGLAPRTSPETASSSSASASTKPAEQQPQQTLGQQQQQQDQTQEQQQQQQESPPTVDVPGSPKDESMKEADSAEASSGANPAPDACTAAASDAQAAADSSHNAEHGVRTDDPACDTAADSLGVDDPDSKSNEGTWGEWHEVAPGGMYDTADSHVVVQNDLSQIPEVN